MLLLLLLFFGSLMFIRHFCVYILSTFTLGRLTPISVSSVHSYSWLHFVLLSSIIIYCFIICLTFCCRLRSNTLRNVIDFAPSRPFNKAILHFHATFCYFFIISTFCIVLHFIGLLFRRQIHSLKFACVCMETKT